MLFSMLIKLYSGSTGNFAVSQNSCSCFVIRVSLNIHFGFKTISQGNAKTLNILFKLAVLRRRWPWLWNLNCGNETDPKLFKHSPNSVKTMYKHFPAIDYCIPLQHCCTQIDNLIFDWNRYDEETHYVIAKIVVRNVYNA